MSDILKNLGNPHADTHPEGPIGPRPRLADRRDARRPTPRLPAHGEQRLLSIDQLHPSGHQSAQGLRRHRADRAGRIRSARRACCSRSSPGPIASRGGFEIVAGERRWRAAQKAGLHTVPVIVRELSDQEAAEFALIENVQRTDLNPIEEATGYSELIERFGYTQEQVAEVDRQEPQPSRQHAAPAAAAGVGAGAAAGRPADLRPRPRADRPRRCRDAGPAHRRGRSQRACRRGPGAGRGPRRRRRQVGAQRGGDDKDADTRAFEKDLSDSLGLKVEIKPGSGESGTLSIKYGNFDQLDYIRARLIGPPER